MPLDVLAMLSNLWRNATAANAAVQLAARAKGFHVKHRKWSTLFIAVIVIGMVFGSGFWFAHHLTPSPPAPTQALTVPPKPVTPPQSESIPAPLTVPTPRSSSPPTQRTHSATQAAPAPPAPTVTPPQSPVTIASAPNGIAITGGKVNQPTVNNYGPPKLEMNEAQRVAIRDAMKPFAGQKFTIFKHNMTEDSGAFADNLKTALVDAGLTVTMDGNGEQLQEGPVPGGVSAQVGLNAIPALQTLGLAMLTNHIISKPIRTTMNNVRHDALDITVAPNH
jgi:hypothetical protein